MIGFTLYALKVDWGFQMNYMSLYVKGIQSYRSTNFQMEVEALKIFRPVTLQSFEIHGHRVPYLKAPRELGGRLLISAKPFLLHLQSAFFLFQLNRIVQK